MGLADNKYDREDLTGSEMKDEYQTLKGPSEGLYKEKGSRFIAHATPVESVDEVRNYLEQNRKAYHDARHHCYAYRIGEEPYEIRYNDDGEPSGTAGKPIYGQIQSFNLTNLIIVVIRYFGGIKLGTGGLIQAYRTASREAILAGEIVTRVWTNQVMINFGYQQMNEVMHIIKEEGLQPKSQDFQIQCGILLEIRKTRTEVLLKKLSNVEKLDYTVI